MFLEEAIRQQLGNHGPLAALVGARIYPTTYPQNETLPVVVYQRTSHVPEYHHDGEAGFAESRFQISSFGKSYAEAKQTARAVKSALRAFMAHQEITNGVLIGACFLENEFDLFNPEDTEQLSAHQVLADFLFLHGEDD